MIIISHRGNLKGPEIEKENSPKFIQEALDAGFHVEIDVWYINNSFFLGHDEPTHNTHLNFLKNDNLWCHAKNIDALKQMIDAKVHCFWHQTDDVTLTSLGYLWTYPGKKLTKNSVCVLPEKINNLNNIKGISVKGVCTDYPLRYKNDLQL